MLHRLSQYLPRKPLPYVLLLCTLAAAVLLFIYSPFAPILILSIYLAYLYFARKFLSVYIDSKFMLFIITLFTHTAIFGLLVIICSAVSNISLHAVLGIELLAFGVMLGYEILHHPRPNYDPRRRLVGADIVSLIISMVAFILLLVIPLTNLSAQKQHSNTLVLITGNVDYGAHLALFNDYLGFGTVRTWGNTSLPRSESGGFYPSSWHAANAAITKIIDPSLHPGTLSAAALGFLNVFWICILVFLLVRLAYKLHDLMSKHNKRSPAVHTVMVLLSLTIIYFFLVHIQRFGFFTITPQLIAILLLIYALYQLLGEGIGSKSALGLATLYCSISLAAWILLLPVAAGAVLLTLLVSTLRKRPSKKDVYFDLRSNWPLYIIAIASIVAQFWLILTVKSPATVTLGSGLLMDGGTPIYNPLVYGLLFAGLVAAMVARKNPQDNKPYEPLLIVVTVTLIFTCLLFGYQTYYTGIVHYYYLKSLLLLPIVLSPLAIAMVGILVSKVKELTFAFMVALLIPVAVIQLVPNDMGVASFIRGSREVSGNVNIDIWKEMHNAKYPTNKVTIYLVSSNGASDIATLLVQADRPYSQCFTNLRSTIMRIGIDAAIQDFTSSPLPQSCKRYDVVFKVDQERASLIPKNRKAKYHIEVINA